MTEPKEENLNTVAIHVRRKPGRPKKYQTEEERSLAKKMKK